VLFAIGNVAHFAMLLRDFAFPVPMVFDSVITVELAVVADVVLIESSIPIKRRETTACADPRYVAGMPHPNRGPVAVVVCARSLS
jgi:hypothetical protein